jgi:hypothetical protein
MCNSPDRELQAGINVQFTLLQMQLNLMAIQAAILELESDTDQGQNQAQEVTR